MQLSPEWTPVTTSKIQVKDMSSFPEVVANEGLGWDHRTETCRNPGVGYWEWGTTQDMAIS